MALLIGLISCAVGLLERAVHAGDWPQLLGPTRDGVAAQDERLPETLPASPSIVWRQEIGLGYAGPAVAEGKVYLFDRDGGEERLSAFDRRTGQTVWQRTFPATYRGGVDADTGPRCVPLVTNDRIVVLGAGGGLHCVSAQGDDAGKVLWSRDLATEFDSKEGYFGIGSSPMALNDLILVNVGGSPDAGIVAFDAASGATRWQATSDDASYSAPNAMRSAATGNKSLAVFVTRLHLRVLDPDDGRVVFSYPFGSRGPTVNAATPLIVDDAIFLTASYGVGAAYIPWKGSDSKAAWKNDESLSSQYNTPVHLDGYLYGIHGREDQGLAELRCIEARTGRVQWSEPGFGVAHLIRIGRQILVLKVDGTLQMIAANPERFEALSGPASSPRLSRSVTRSLPAWSDGDLFLRDNSGEGGTLYCVRLAP